MSIFWHIRLNLLSVIFLCVIASTLWVSPSVIAMSPEAESWGRVFRLWSLQEKEKELDALTESLDGLAAQAKKAIRLCDKQLYDKSFAQLNKNWERARYIGKFANDNLKTVERFLKQYRSSLQYQENRRLKETKSITKIRGAKGKIWTEENKQKAIQFTQQIIKKLEQQIEDTKLELNAIKEYQDRYLNLWRDAKSARREAGRLIAEIPPYPQPCRSPEEPREEKPQEQEDKEGKVDKERKEAKKGLSFFEPRIFANKIEGSNAIHTMQRALDDCNEADYQRGLKKLQTAKHNLTQILRELVGHEAQQQGRPELLVQFARTTQNRMNIERILSQLVKQAESLPQFADKCPSTALRITRTVKFEATGAMDPESTVIGTERGVLEIQIVAKGSAKGQLTGHGRYTFKSTETAKAPWPTGTMENSADNSFEVSGTLSKDYLQIGAPKIINMTVSWDVDGKKVVRQHKKAIPDFWHRFDLTLPQGVYAPPTRAITKQIPRRGFPPFPESVKLTSHITTKVERITAADADRALNSAAGSSHSGK